MSHSVTATIGQSPITIETGKLARLADGAVTVRSGETIVLVSAVSATTIKEGQDWFPLTVDYREKAAAVGKFPGGYFKREGRPSEKEILTCRMTDRPLRPLFPKGYLYDTQIIGILLSADGEHDPDILFINGASAALCVSDIPFAGPVGAVRVGRIDGQFVANPAHSQRVMSDLDLVYVGTEHDVIMIEGEANELPEEDFIAALAFAHDQVGHLIAAQKELTVAAGKPKRQAALFVVPDELLEIAYASRATASKPRSTLRARSPAKRPSTHSRTKSSAAILEKFPEATKFEISQAFDYLQKKAFRVSILDKTIRCDGRSYEQIRPLSAKTACFPAVTAARSSRAAKRRPSVSRPSRPPTKRRNSTATPAAKPASASSCTTTSRRSPSVKPAAPAARAAARSATARSPSAPSRRSFPTCHDFPYAIRVSSEVMESNGSTSMATVCAGVLALMDAGVPISKPVAGISCGLVTEFSGRHHRGTRCSPTSSAARITSATWTSSSAAPETGVTGFQLDLKLPGIPLKLMEEAIYRTRDARFKVLEVMNAALAAPRAELSPYAPRIETIRIKPDKIGLIIGPGGKTIKGIVAETGAEINIEDDGTVHIYSNNGEGLARAKQIIDGMTKEIEVGETLPGPRRHDQGVRRFVEVLARQGRPLSTSASSPTSA